MAYFSADTGLKALVGVFVFCCLFLTTSYNTTFAFDRPACSAVLACFLAGSTFLALGRFIRHLPQIAPPPKVSIIPLAERGESASGELSASPVGHVDESYVGTIRNLSLWKKVALISVIGCIRVEFYREISLNIECAPTGYTYAVPFLVSLYDYWSNQQSRPIDKSFAADSTSWKKFRILGTLYRRASSNLCQCRMRYVIAAGFLLAGGLITSRFHDGKESTYICPIISGLALRLHIFRLLNVFLDSLILIGAAELSRDVRTQEARRGMLVSWSYPLLGVAIFWAITGAIIAKRTTGVGPNGFIDAHYLRSAFGQSVLVVFLLLSASQMIRYYGIVGISLLGGFVSIYFSWASALFNGQVPYPMIPASHAFIALVSIVAGGILLLCSRRASEDDPKFLYGTNLFIRSSILCLFGVGLVFVFNQPRLANLHAIDLLIYEGRVRHDAWLSQAAGSQSLKAAVWEYRRRYNQYPPPGFDKWYHFATSRGSVIIDDFDQIYNNLLPFRALPPERLREMTHELATNPFNDLGAISIRNGAPRVQEGIKPTHAWMVSGAAEMIEKFSKHLPDMDIVFNLNDEPRVAVPWGKLSALRNQAKRDPPPSDDIVNGWSKDRELGWGPLEPAHQTNQSMFTDAAWSNIYDRYVSAVCPPSSRARSQRIWNRHDICMSCIRPHSLGQFPVDWNIATNICHQPDLESLHGFIMSPASFKVSQDLAPVFSQSSMSGFSDLLYPSPWNYMDKVRFDPSVEFPDRAYREKANSLFWIGSTSEGVSTNGQWKGMPRQRLAHMVNNNTLSKVSVLLPADKPETYSYQVMDGTAPLEQLGLNTDVHLADPIVRCGDCEQQQEELNTAGWMNFQNHWSYRYLFDLDGAGFSGRFLPFMLSHSIPFKTGLLRQWLDARVTAWLHFVPIDLRLHGVWSTLAYFSGVDAVYGGRRTLMAPHDLEGEWIAEEGRKWAEKTLRKEDMEIYFFRLLLEWGRLTDDRRDVLGYIPKS